MMIKPHYEGKVTMLVRQSQYIIHNKFMNIYSTISFHFCGHDFRRRILLIYKRDQLEFMDNYD